MNKIFIACPFIKYVNGTDFTNDNYRKFTEDLYDLCLNYAPEVFLALKREEYGSKPIKNYSCQMDFDELMEADVIVAVPDDSMGVAVELGWASACNKYIIILLNKEQKYSALVKNITTVTQGEIIWYEGEERNAMSDISDALERLTI
ncbi:MAG: nucleoside 2-deoxyribosyltransferase [Firmicutes bacterium]|nr:nucleoside 2-deoxyribosyltransferase [Bacillota bacterium]